MLYMPCIIKENFCSINELYNDNEFFIRINLLDSNEEIDCQIAAAIENKFNIMLKNRTGQRLFQEVQSYFKNIDIFFDNYELISEINRKYINSLIRIGNIVGNGKLLFHIISKFRYRELVSKGFIFETFCDYEKILLGHEIQQLEYHNGIWIDRIKAETKNKIKRTHK